MARVENLLGALSITMADRFREVGAAHRMSASEQASLVTLLAHPDRPVSWLGEVLGLTSSGVTRLVDRLVARGWVTRTPGADARHRRLRLTSSGTKRARTLNRDREAVLADAVAVLTEADRTELERLLDSLVGALHEDLMPTMHTCRLCDRGVCRSSGVPCPLDHTVPTDV
jgi:DNA-binding MarR family transcriptional regulator